MIPQKVNIGGHIYEIKVIDGYIAYNQTGEHDSGLNIIKLDSKTAETKRQQDLVHEIIHSILAESGAYLMLKDVGVNHETFVTVLENIMWRFLSDNTSFFNN